MNFPRKWISWISSMLSSSKVSPLINGSACSPFFIGQGVRQGDPLSPLLFVLAVEGLKRMIDKACRLGITRGVALEDDDSQISVLQFADDTLFFVPNDMALFDGLISILRCFELISGLKINFSKSSLSGVNCNAESIDFFARRIGCKVEETPITYLGLPLSHKQVSSSLWSPILARMKQRIGLWHGSLLSTSGHLVLVQSVLQSLPIYFLSLYAAPKGFLRASQCLASRFLWFGDAEKRGIHKVAWDIACLPKKMGGLGCSNLSLLNKGLLLKWFWKLQSAPNDYLWKRVSCLSSNMENWHSHILVENVDRSHVWKGVIKACTNDPRVWELFMGACSMRIGDGNSTLFWHDNWGADRSFKALYPELFSLVLAPDASVHVGLNWSWRRQLRSGVEAASFADLQGKIEAVPMACERFDWPLWKGKANGYSSRQFSAHWYATFPLVSIDFPFRKIWSSLASPKVKFFCWLAIRRSIPCSDFLVARGVNLFYGRFCTLCMDEIEDVDHTLLHCPTAWNF